MGSRCALGRWAEWRQEGCGVDCRTHCHPPELALPKPWQLFARDHRKLCAVSRGVAETPGTGVWSSFQQGCLSVAEIQQSCEPSFPFFDFLHLPLPNPSPSFERRLFWGQPWQATRGETISGVTGLTWRTTRPSLTLLECGIVPVLNEVLENDFQMLHSHFGAVLPPCCL